MTTPQEKIQAILDKCSTGKYIFRGENKEYGKVSSGLYRQYCQRDDSKPVNDSNPTTNDPLIDNEHFFVSSVEQDIVEKVKKHIGPAAPNIEVLTELQHYGGKTALLDFSKDLHIALFFACDGNFDKNGRVIFFKTSELTESTDIDYNQIDTTKHTLISPTGKNPRVIFQSSIFVHVPKGYLEVFEYDIIEIENDLKEPLLDYLSKYFNINTETIYNDIQGFIRNQHNHSTAEVEFYRGNANADSGKYKEAITNYDKAIELNPQRAIAYNNRGIANFNLDKHEEAITDYTKAIELNPQYAIAYRNRGIAKLHSGKNEEAIEDYDKAIEFNPKHAKAYNNRGNAKLHSGKNEEAIEDYNKAIELNPQFADTYYNRGNAKLALHKYKEAIKDYSKAIDLNPKHAIAYCNRGIAKSALGKPEAIEDYDKAKTLYAEAGNMEMIEKCEEVIALLKRRQD